MRSKFFVGMAISMLLLCLAVRQVNVHEFTEALAQVRMGYVLPAFLLTLGVCLFRAMRWRLLFSPAKRISLHDLFSVIMVGFLANNLLPARLGELAMIYLIDKKQAVGKSLSAGTILLDRLMDVSTLVMFLLVSFLLFPFPTWVKHLALIGTTFLALVAAFFWLALSRREVCVHALRFCSRLLPARMAERVLQIFVMFVDGLAVLQRVEIMLQVTVLSLLVWIGLGSTVYLLFLAFNFPLSFSAAIIVLAIVNLALTIPSSPGFVGTFQFFCVTALGLFAVDKSHALSFSLVYHLSQWLPTTLLGFYYLNKENLSLGRLAAISQT
jgi:uncharacterized protein (TIRG00374 family)